MVESSFTIALAAPKTFSIQYNLPLRCSKPLVSPISAGCLGSPSRPVE